MAIVIRVPLAAIARAVCASSALALLACSGTKKPVEEHVPVDASTTTMKAPGGSGGTSGMGTMHPMRDAGCTVAPDDELGACTDQRRADAGVHDAGMRPLPHDAGASAHAGVPDASAPLDAGWDAGSSPPATADEGECAQRQMACSVGRAVTTIGTATCTISGDSLRVDRQICEVCGESTVLGDYVLMVMDCNRECTPIYSQGRGLVADPIAANECIDTADFAVLTGTDADEHCIDVYTYVGSGNTNFGWMLEASDQVRVCRCDRTTDTCVSCANHACD